MALSSVKDNISQQSGRGVLLEVPFEEQYKSSLHYLKYISTQVKSRYCPPSPSVQQIIHVPTNKNHLSTNTFIDDLLLTGPELYICVLRSSGVCAYLHHDLVCA